MTLIAFTTDLFGSRWKTGYQWTLTNCYGENVSKPLCHADEKRQLRRDSLLNCRWQKTNAGKKRTAGVESGRLPIVGERKKQQCVFSSRICYSAARTPTDANTTKSVICIGNGVRTASTAERMTSQPAYDNTIVVPIGRVKAWSERPTQRSSTASWAELSWALITA